MYYYQNENFSNCHDIRCKFHDNFIVPAHLHEYSEIIFALKGNGTVYINEREILLDEKKLIYIPPNTIHRYVFSKANVICAVFSNDFVPLFFKSLNKRIPVPAPIDFSDEEPVLHSLLEKHKENPILSCGYLHLILNKVYENSELVLHTDGDSVLYKKVITYLSENFTSPVTLSVVAEKIGYNEKYLSEKLHALTGLNFRALVALYRVQLARELLIAKREKEISEIAMECGYMAFNTFNRQFKMLTGQTPREYRNGYVRL